MKKIPLSKGFFALVDDEDFDEMSKYKWNPQKNGSRIYAKRTSNEILKSGNKKTYFMHRQILGVTDKKIDIDHKDGNCLNNQRSNLRPCSRSFNNGNMKISKLNTSGYKGVHFDKSRGLWVATVGRKRIGRFKTKEEAAIKYNEAAIKKWGEFARLNNF